MHMRTHARTAVMDRDMRRIVTTRPRIKSMLTDRFCFVLLCYFSFPLVWSLGCILGELLGGTRQHLMGTHERAWCVRWQQAEGQSGFAGRI